MYYITTIVLLISLSAVSTCSVSQAKNTIRKKNHSLKVYPIKVENHITGFTTQFRVDRYKMYQTPPSVFKFKFYIVCQSRSCKRRRRQRVRRMKLRALRNLKQRNLVKDRRPTPIHRNRKHKRISKKSSSNLKSSKIMIRVNYGSLTKDFQLEIFKSSWKTIELPFSWLITSKSRMKLKVLCIYGCTSPNILVVGTKRAPSKICPRKKKKTPDLTVTSPNHSIEKRQKVKRRCRKRKPAIYI